MPMLTTFTIRLPVCPVHAPLRTRSENSAHPIEDGVDPRHDVLAIDDDRLTSRRAQGHVQHSTIFCDVDLFACEHGVDSPAKVGFLGQLHEQGQSCRQ